MGRRDPRLREVSDEMVDLYLRYLSDRGAAIKATPTEKRPCNWLSQATREFWHIASLEEFCVTYITVMKPDIELGLKFRTGRKPGKKGQIRQAIAKILAKHTTIKNPAIWKELESKPPKGFQFYDNQRFGKYIEGPTVGTDMGYGRFCTICGEERKKIMG
jgi:hypothetical protein